MTPEISVLKKPMGKHFSHPEQSVSDLRVAILEQRNFKETLQYETTELQDIKWFNAVTCRLKEDKGFLAHYTC